MLGAASLLASRPDAFLAFLFRAGLGPAVRLFAQRDETHIATGVLASVLTVAVLITTGRIYHTVESSLRLQSENGELVENLQAAKEQTETLNRALELGVPGTDGGTAQIRRTTAG